MEDKFLILETFNYLKGLKKVRKYHVYSKNNPKKEINTNLKKNDIVDDKDSQIKTKNAVELPKRAIKIFKVLKNINAENSTFSSHKPKEKKVKSFLNKKCKKINLIQLDIPNKSKMFKDKVSKSMETDHSKYDSHSSLKHYSNNEKEITNNLPNDNLEIIPSKRENDSKIYEFENRVSGSFEEVFDFNESESVINEIIPNAVNNIPEKVQDWINHIPLKNGSQETCKKAENSDYVESKKVVTNYPSLPAILNREESLQSNSSLDSILESRRPDPVEIFLNLGFGGVPGVDMEICRIPKRFLVPSKCKGGDWNEFLKRELIQALNFECSSLGFRGLSGPSYRRPSAIVANIMEKLRECSTNQPCSSRSRFTKNYGNDKSPEDKLCMEFQSVLSPDNRKFLQSQGKISPEVPRRRIIFGQKSFAFGRDGEFVEVSSSPAKNIGGTPNNEVLIKTDTGDNPESKSCDESRADNLLKYRRGSLQKQKRVIENSTPPPNPCQEDEHEKFYVVEKELIKNENENSESIALDSSSKRNNCNNKIPRRFLSSSNLKSLGSESNLTEMMRREIEKEIRSLSQKIKSISDQDLISVLKQVKELSSTLETSPHASEV